MESTFADGVRTRDDERLHAETSGTSVQSKRGSEGAAGLFVPRTIGCKDPICTFVLAAHLYEYLVRGLRRTDEAGVALAAIASILGDKFTLQKTSKTLSIHAYPPPRPVPAPASRAVLGFFSISLISCVDEGHDIS